MRAAIDASAAALASAEWAAGVSVSVEPPPSGGSGSERRRRIRDAVEAALSDVILLGTQAQAQVRLAALAASDMGAGRPIETADLVASLRSFIREVLDLESIPGDVLIPKQGPLRVAASGPRSGSAGQGGGKSAQGGGGADGGGGGVMMAAGVPDTLALDDALAPKS